MSLPAVVKGSPGFSIFGTSHFLQGKDDEGDRPLYPNQREAITRLNAAYAGSAYADWDGEGAAPANGLSRLYAERFLKSIRGSTTPPDVWFNRQGDAVFEWRPAPGRIALISVGGAGQLRYAIKIPAGRIKGVENFADAIPDRLLSPLLAALRP